MLCYGYYREYYINKMICYYEYCFLVEDGE